jgi:hypothetical protein
VLPLAAVERHSVTRAWACCGVCTAALACRVLRDTGAPRMATPAQAVPAERECAQCDAEAAREGAGGGAGGACGGHAAGRGVVGRAGGNQGASSRRR